MAIKFKSLPATSLEHHPALMEAAAHYGHSYTHPFGALHVSDVQELDDGVKAFHITMDPSEGSDVSVVGTLTTGIGTPPWESVHTAEYTILDALRDFSHGKLPPGRKELHLRSVIDPAVMFKVKSYDTETSRCVLETSEGGTLKPVIGQREVPLYTPYWV